MQYILTDVSFHTASGVEHTSKAILYAEDDTISTGSLIQSYGPVQGFSQNRNEGNFDYSLYYKSHKILFQQFPEDIRVIREPAFSLRETLYRLRKQMKAGIMSAFAEEEAGILCAMLLGDKSILPEETSELYRRNGISHIMAISGLHISIFGMSVFRLLQKKFHIRYLYSCCISGVIVFLFVLMSGMSISAMRAMIMFFFYIGAKWSGRTYDSLTALLYSGVVLLLGNPLAVMQTGFQLSYGAVLSIGLILPVLEDVLPEPAFLKKLPGGQSLFRSARLSLAVWIGLTPLTASVFYYISPYSVWLNLIVVPCCPLLMADGLVCALAGSRLPGITGILSLPDRWILKFFAFSMHGAGRLPAHQWITGHIPAWRLLLYYGVLLACCMLIRRWKRRQRRRHLLLYLLPLCLLIFVLWNPLPKTFRVDFLDVGQGDGICISSSQGTCVMIDGGSTTEDRVGTDRILPFLMYHKVRSVDLWIVSHTDEDHVNGLLEILQQGYSVRALAVSDISFENEAGSSDTDAADKDDMMEQLLEAAEKNDTKVITASAGAVIQEADLKMRCLYPEKEETAHEKNDLSMVWLLSNSGWDFLFTGDLGEEEEKTLCARGLISPADVLKVGHHGSDHSGSDAFLNAVRPSYAVISVGKGNRYHHPGKKALKRLKNHNAVIETTMEYGQITFIQKKKRLYLYHFCSW